MLLSAAVLLGVVAAPPSSSALPVGDDRVAQNEQSRVPEPDQIRMWAKPGGGMTFALAVDPTKPGTVYAGTERGGIFKSIDAGRTWRRLRFSWQSGRVVTVAVDGGGTVYAGREDGSFLKSTDGGESWNSIALGTVEGKVRSFVIDARGKAVTFYLGTSTGEVGRSGDGGKTWSWSKDGLEGRSIASLVVDHGKSLVLWAGTMGGIFRSSDGGVHFRKVTSLAVHELAVDPTRPGTIVAASEGVFRSIDAGKTWRPVGHLRRALSLLVEDRKKPATLYVGTSYDSVQKSTDGGASWTPASGGLSPLGEVLELAADPRTTPPTLYAATSHVGVFRSVDGGTSWQRDEGEVPGVKDADDAPRPGTP